MRMLLRRRHGGLLKRAFLAVCAVAVVLSFGYRGSTRPLYELYAQLPTVGLFRTPERFRLLIFFCVIALAVMGLGRVARGFDGTSVLRGSIALGHPWSATGVRLVSNLAHEMSDRDASLGLISACAGGALGGAMLLERA